MGAFSKYTDNDLIHLISEGNVDAFAEVYERYWSKLYNAAHKRLRNDALCEEVVQDVFLKYWEKRNTLIFSIGLSNYLHTAIKYSVIDYYRKELLKDKYLQVNRLVEAADNSNEEHIYLMDLRRLVEKVIDTLPAKCKTVYQLSRIENKNNKEIASLLNISEKTVEGHLTNALKLLKISLADFSMLLLVFLIK
ncbi:RNA polymerase sigma-70 factor (ECF subfamily) [Pedobacter psychrotolerans]|uniref:RNA polymerase sigma-70 factor n=1 Tax=Pedobacter psychrotolerans TaxID=1843235 RepID=A0A4R2HJ87_9SPHI|nr:RNA polymerase sigma-70 factor [Pedobacter psychrotolerans]TCO28846.1 RNA polymerase sigma-70 factor (ECF subfamily) [Pedobacter psychrotolerans]GGE52222.1 RNA polymerase sigma-70 factor [Pedobacter psychrotolerans]